MSWSISHEFTSLEEDVRTELEDKIRAAFGQQPDTPFEFSKVLDVALSAVEHAIVTEALGVWDKLSVTLSGHNNPGQKAVPGYANPGLNISMQATPAAASAGAADTSAAAAPADASGGGSPAEVTSTTDQPADGSGAPVTASDGQ